MEKGLGNAHPLPVALGKFADEPMRNIRDAAALNYLINLTLPFAARNALYFSKKLKIGKNRHIKIERHCFREVAQSPADFKRVFQCIIAADARRAAGLGEKTGKDAHGGCFPGAVWSEKPHNFPLLYRKRNILNAAG